MSGQYGVTAKLGWGSGLPVTDPLEFIRDTVRCYETLTDFQGISGKRGHKSNRKQVTRKIIDGEVECTPNAKEWTYILPRLLGAAAVGNVYNLAETLPAFNHVADRGALVHTFTGCKINRGVITARENGGVNAVLSLLGQAETMPPGAAGTFPALTIDETTQSFILPQGAVTIGGNPFQIDNLSLTFDNHLVARYANSLTATEIVNVDRTDLVALRVPWGDFYTAYADGAAATPIVITFTNGGTSIQFSYPSVRIPKTTPPIEGREEEWYQVNGEAGIDGSGNPEVTVTLDSIP